ncbi:MAG: prepilin-type N-terminal cleavage/methylation domain-containing protein [Pseudomonadota bacterium]
MRRPRGFTLIELVIVLSIVSLLTVVLFSSLRLGVRGWNTVDVRDTRLQETRLVRGFIRNALASARAVQFQRDLQPPVLMFQGDTQRIEWVAPLSQFVGVGGLHLMRLEIEGGDRGILRLTRWLYHPAILDGQAGVPAWQPLDKTRATRGLPATPEALEGVYDSQVLLARVQGGQFGYFGQRSDEQVASWHDTWNDPVRLPDLVTVALIPEGGHWPTLAVVPGASGLLR